jgi:large repetitive protein
MFPRSFRRFLTNRKTTPISSVKRARPQVRPLLEKLEDRLAPATITQWEFASGTSINNAQNGSTENTVAQVTPTTGSGNLYTLGMYNSFNGGNSALDDSTSTPGTADPGFSEFTLRVRGAQTPTGHNGWATAAAGAAEYTQGIEADASTAGFTNITFSFDWYSTTQGIRDLQVQYNTNVNNAGGWTNFVEPGGTGSNGISTTGTFLATANDYWNATASNGANTITVNFGSYADNDPNFGVRLVSAFDSTGHVPNDYASAQLSGGQTVIYNNSSGNWRFNNLTFAAGSSASTSSTLTASPVSPQNPGTTIALTDTITPSSGSQFPTGTVEFFDGSTQIGSTQNVSGGSGNTGVASINVNTSGSPMSLGVHNLTAQYFPTGGFSGSTTPNVAYSIGDPTSSVVTASPASPQKVGTTVTFTDTITPANIGGTGSPDGHPTGTVQFFDGSTALGSPINVSNGSGSTGTASYTDNGTLASGTHNITAVYSPTANYLGSTSSALGYALYSGNPGPFTPGNLVILQSGDGTNQYNAQAPLFLDEITTTGSEVQQDAIPDTGAAAITGAIESGTTVTITTTAAPGLAGNGFTSGEIIVIAGLTPTGYDGTFTITVTGATTFTYTAASGLGAPTISNSTATPGQLGNQPITIDLSAAAGNGQLNRSYDGSSLSFDGVDSTINNGGLTGSATPTGQDNRVIGVLTGDPSITSDYNTSTYGPFYVGDDNRGSVAESPTGPIYTAGHPNQAGGAVSQGVHEFDTEGQSIGTQVSASTNIRGVTIGFDNRMYFSTASGLGGTGALNAAGIFTEAQPLPTSGTSVPANDIMVVPAIFGASKLGGVWLADMNGDGILDNGDRLYFLDDGTVGGIGTGGIYVATWNTANTNNPWNTPNNAAAAAAGYADFWSSPVRLGDAPAQTGSGGVGQLRGLTGTVVSAGIATASESGTTVTITLSGSNPFQANQNVEISGVGAGYDGSWTITAVTGSTLTYTALTSGLSTVNNSTGLASQAVLYTTAFDNAANDNSYIQQWYDTNTGASVAQASESGSTVTITTATPNTFQTGQTVEVDGVGANSGAAAITTGYNGAWSITVVDATHFTYTDTNSGANNLGTINNQGAADVTVNGSIIQTLASGTDVVGGKNFADIGLRGVSFAPVAATSITLTQSPANPLSPGTPVTLTATLSNSQVIPTGEVTFVDANTNTVLGEGAIGTSGGVTTATLTTTLVGDHYVQAYFSGGGVSALASARSNTIQVLEAGNSSSSTSLTASPTAAAIGKTVTLTATVTSGATGTVSFYNGSVALTSLLGTSSLSGTTATFTTAFNTTGTQTIFAVYNGDNTYASSQGNTTVNVAPNATGTITTSANDVALNATPTYTATIVGNATLGVPAGSVTFTIVSATTNTSGNPLVTGTSGAITLNPGSGDTATATWTSPALSAPGSYFVTISYSATGANNPYSNFAITTANASNGVALIETVQQAFKPGDIVAVQRGDGTVNLGSSAYPVVLVEYKQTGGAEVQAIVMPDADSGSTHALFLSGQNSSEGLLNRSANGADLTLSGYDLPAGHTFVTSTFPFQDPRTIAEVNGSGSIDTSTAISTTQVPISAASESGTTATLTVASPASVSVLSVGELVVVTGITPSGYDGQFSITGINTTNNTFTYTAASGLGSGTVNNAFATSASVPYNPLDVVSADGQQFWVVSNLPVGDTTDNGIEYATLGATSATQIGNGNNGAAAVTIAGGQLYVTTGKNLQAVGTGLPTAVGQSVTGLPNLANAYQSFFPNTQNPEQVLLLNTNDGTTNNPNVAYIADQANGLLKFYLNTASISSLSESGTTVTVTTGTQSTPFSTGDQVQISGASIAGYNGTFAITAVDSTHFTYTASASGLAAATAGTASEWLYGRNGTGVFGQKLVFAGGATGVTGYVMSPGASAQVQLFVTGSNVQQQNPNQIDSLLDTNSPSQGFPSGNFTVLGFVGGANSSGSPNGNENFAGLAFVPGAVTTVTVTSNHPTTTYGNNVTFTATVTSPADTPSGTVTFYDGITLLGTSTLNGSGVATFTTTAPLVLGAHTITAQYNPGGASLATDDAGSGTTTQTIDYTPGDLVVSQVGFSANIASISVSGSTVTVTTTNAIPFATGQFVTIAGNSGTNTNGSYPITVTNPMTFTYTSSGAVAGTGGTVSPASSFTISSVSVSGSTVSVTTSGSSGFLVGQQVTIAGYTNSGSANINGTFVLISVSGTTLKYTSSGAAAGSGTATGTASGPTALTGSATATYLADFTGPTANPLNTVNAPTAVAAATVTGATWNVSNNTVTVTTAAAHNFQPGQLVTIASVSPGGYNGSFTILSVPSTTTFTYGLVSDPGAYTSGGTALVDQGALTEGGTSTTQGYLTASSDGHSLTVGGYDQTPGGSTSTTAAVGVVSPSGSIDNSTLIPSSVSGVRATIAPDGLGMWVATGSGIRYVAFGGTTPSAITNASWASTSGGTATITAANQYLAGETVTVAGIGTATGYNGTFVVLSASATQFTYFLPTQPTGTPTFTGATSVQVPTLVTNEANNLQNGQFPTTVAIGTSPTFSTGTPGYLYGDAGNQFQTNGVPSIDGPFTVGSNLPENGGQAINVLGTGTGQNFPNSTDIYGNFPTSAQIAVSPDGQTIFVADSRTDGLGGLLEYFQAVNNSWVLLGRLQLDSFAVTGASESGTTVTVTTSSATDFFVGESVSVFGLQIAAYDGTFTVSGVSSSSFTYTANFSGLTPTQPGIFGATATSADGGFRALTADFTDGGKNDGGVILDATTSATTGNRLVKITGGTWSNGNANGPNNPNFAYTVLATAAPNAAFRGVAFAPTAPGTTSSSVTLQTSSGSGNFAGGVTLTATLSPSAATGWVSFRIGSASGMEIGAAPVINGTATFSTGGDLAPGSYNIVAVYTGDNTYAASPASSSVSVTISKTNTSTTLTFNPPSVGTNQSETITAIVSGVPPTGLVTFTNTTSSTTLGNAPVSQVIVNNNGTPQIVFEATLTVPGGTFTAGTYNISGAYSGDAYFSSSTGTGSLSVVNSTTTTVTASSANPNAATGDALTLTATVTSPAGGTPGGTVQFYDDTLPLGGTLNLNGSGVATLTINTTLVQSVTVTSAAQSTDGGGNTTVTITTNANNPMTVGELVTVEGINTQAYDGTFTVAAVSGKTFSYADANAAGAPTDTNGGLAIGLNVLTPGLHGISAVYTPTGANLSSFSGSTGVHEQTVQGLTFAAADVYQERNGDGITPLNTRSPNPVLGSIGVTVYVDELTPSGTLVQSFALPTADSQVFNITSASLSGTTLTITTTSPNDYAVGQTVTVVGINQAAYDGNFVITGLSGNSINYTVPSGQGSPTLGSTPTVQGAVHAVVGDGQQSTTGQMALSGDGQDLFITGYDNNPLPFGTALPVPSASGSNLVLRSIAEISYNGTVQTESFSVGATGINTGGVINGIFSPDGTQFYLSGFNGIYYFPSITASATPQGSTAGNQIVGTGFTVNGLEAYGGNLYEIGTGSTAGTANRIAEVGTGFPKADVSTVTNASWASGVATITAANDYTVGESVTVAGITGTTGSSYNGTFTLTAVTGTTFSYNLATQPTGTPGFAAATASLQQVLTQLPGIPVNSTNEPIPVFFGVDAYFTHTNTSVPGSGLDTIYLADDGKSFGAGDITKWSLTSVNISGITESGSTATVTLATAGLGLVAGETVNLTIAGEVPTAYNGTFSVTVTSPTTFTFTAPSGTGSDTTHGTASGFVESSSAILYSEATEQLGFYWLAGTTNPTTGAVTLYSTYGNGGNADFGPGITYQVTDSNGFAKAPGVPITGATWSSGKVTITAPGNNYQLGQFVNISGMTPAGYNGLFTITAVNNGAGTFQYALVSNPGTDTTNGVALSINTVDSVAFEGVGGGYAGNETIRGVAFGPQPLIGSVVTGGDKDTFGIASASETSTTVTISTYRPNDFVTGQQIEISGVGVVGYNTQDQPNSNTVPSGPFFTITVLSPTQFAYSDPNFTNLASAGLGGQATAVSWSIASSSQPAPVSISTITESSGTVATVTTSSANTFATGDEVTISGNSNGAYNGTFPNITVLSNTQFTFTTSTSGNGSGTGGTAGDNTVTAVMSATEGLQPGQLVTISGVSMDGSTTNGYNGTYTVLRAVGDPTLSYDAAVTDLDPGAGGGAAASLAGRQRSMVDSIQYQFGQQVTLGPGAFTVTPVAGTATINAISESAKTVTVTTAAAHGFYIGDPIVINFATAPDNEYNGTYLVTGVPSTTTFTFTAGSAGLPNDNSASGTAVIAPIVATATNPSADQESYVVSFTVPSFPSAIVGNSIFDGAFNIQVNVGDITLVSTGQHPQAIPHSTDTFVRQFGDVNGDQVVNTFDARAFSRAFNTQSTDAAYLAYLDFSAGGVIGTAASRAFSQRFNLPVSFGPFTPTI